MSFSKLSWQTGSQWVIHFKYWKENSIKIQNQIKASFKGEGKIKKILNMQKLRKFSTTKFAW